MIVLGFGCIEERTRETIKRELMESASNGKTWEDVAAEYMARAEEYKTLSKEMAPERYTYFFLIGDKIVWHHINRRYPLSPDGWALLRIEEPLLVRG